MEDIDPRPPEPASPWGIFYIPPLWFDPANADGAADVMRLRSASEIVVLAATMLDAEPAYRFSRCVLTRPFTRAATSSPRPRPARERPRRFS